MDFSTVVRSMWTLLMAGAMTLDGASGIMTDLVFSEQWPIRVAGWGFVVYMCITCLMVMQMLLGVLVQVIQDVTEKENNIIAMKKLQQNTLDIVNKSDQNQDHCMSQQEFIAMVQSNECLKFLQDMDVDVVLMLHMMRKVLPDDEAEASIGDISKVILECRGDQPATVATCAGCFHGIIREVVELRKGVESVLGHQKTVLGHWDTLHHQLRTQGTVQDLEQRFYGQK